MPESLLLREKLILDNQARYVKLPRGRRPFAVVWTARRVEEWHRTGSGPAVAVWTVLCENLVLCVTCRFADGYSRLLFLEAACSRGRGAGPARYARPCADAG